VYASAAAGSHIVLANGNYGARTLNRSFPSGNRLVVRAQNQLGATFTSMQISGSGQIVSGVVVDRGAAVANGTCLTVGGSNVRFTRGAVRNGGTSLLFGAGITDALIDHCQVHRFRDRATSLADPKDQRRITVARCWFHEILEGNDPFSNCFAWGAENIYREREIDIVVRFCYAGPGIAAGVPENDYVHHKTSLYIYAFNRFDVPANHRISQRFGRKSRFVGNYGPNGRLRLWDDIHWVYGNVWGNVECPAGISAYYDENKSLVDNNQGGFPATTRMRMAGNQVAGAVSLGIDLSNNTFCTRTDGPLPDAQPAGVAKPARSWNGVDYAAMPAGDGLSIRAHSGTIAIDTGMTCLSPQAVNVSSLPGNAAPDSWLSDLLTEYSWISDICPNPTTLTGGPGGTAPWSIAQALTRGDAANPNTGPFRASPGGLP
jgi:hypothetical protein